MLWRRHCGTCRLNYTSLGKDNRLSVDPLRNATSVLHVHAFGAHCSQLVYDFEVYQLGAGRGLQALPALLLLEFGHRRAVKASTSALAHRVLPLVQSVPLVYLYLLLVGLFLLHLHQAAHRALEHLAFGLLDELAVFALQSHLVA